MDSHTTSTPRPPRRQALTPTPSRHAPALLLCAAAVLAAMLLCAPSALALSQRGHSFSSSFGSSGEPGTTLSDPGALAVSEAGETAGDVYVLDRGHNRIVRYGPKGEFLSAWGWGVGPGKKYEVCKSECHAGIAGAKKDELNGDASIAIAVDDSTGPSEGDVYLATEGEIEKESGYEQIDKFTPSGEPIEAITQVKYLTSEPVGKTESERKKEEKELSETEELEAEEVHGLTVAPDGTPWLYYEEDLYPLSDASLQKDPGPPPLSFSLAGEPARGLALDAEGHVYIAQQLGAGTPHARSVASKWNLTRREGGETQLTEVSDDIDDLPTPAVATDAVRSDVYLDNNTSIAAYAASGAPIERFGEEPEGALHEAAGLAINGHTRDVYVSEGDQIEVFAPEASGRPTIEEVSAQEVGSASAQLHASIDPRGASAPTTYAFEYGAGPCPASCTTVPGGPFGGPAFGDEGFGEEAVQVALGAGTPYPLSAGVTYHYRASASNEHGQAASVERAFTVPPASPTADERGWEMVSPPEKQGAYVYAPGIQWAGVIQAAENGQAVTYIANGPFAAAEGSRNPVPAQILSTRGSDGWHSKDIVTPNASGAGIVPGYEEAQEYEYFSTDLSLALVKPYPGGGPFAEPPLSPPVSEGETQRREEERRKGEPLRYQETTAYIRADEPIGEAGEEPLQPGHSAAIEPHGELESEIYAAAAANGPEMQNPGYLPLVDGADAPGAQFGGERLTEHILRLATATPDLGHVLIESGVPLSAGAGEHGIYEWSKQDAGPGMLEQVNLLPASGAPLPEAEVGDQVQGNIGRNLRHAISTDGTRIVFSAEGHLYMRDTDTPPGDPNRKETIQLDLPSTGASGEGTASPTFQTASADGSRVFFTDEQALTERSGTAPGKPDLYVCEIHETVGHTLGCALTDLTPPDGGESAYVQPGLAGGGGHGGVLGASEDGTYVYFIADGVLSSEPNPQGEKASTGLCGAAYEAYPHPTCNIYMRHYDSETHSWQPPVFIATLAGSSESSPTSEQTGDERDWNAVNHGQGSITSRVSPDGQYLAFMSERELTGYDNRDSSPAAHGAHDQEVFLYHAQGEGASPASLTCASCDPSGARPAGVFDPPSEANKNLFIDENHNLEGQWLAGSLPESPGINGKLLQDLYQNRVLFNSGRLYFDSPADLVAGATNHEEDVYEYEPLGVPQGSHRCAASSAAYSEAAGGCIGLISSGTSTSESAFLDASETGGEGPHGEQLDEGGADVFFATAAGLVPQDTDGEYDAYDAHECTSGSPCVIPPEEKPPPFCESTQDCRSYTPPAASTLGAPASANAGAAANLTPQHAVLPSKTTVTPKPKPLTAAQKLAKALKSCRARFEHSKRKLGSCERQARAHYAKHKRAKKSAHTTKATRKGTR